MSKEKAGVNRLTHRIELSRRHALHRVEQALGRVVNAEIIVRAQDRTSIWVDKYERG